MTPPLRTLKTGRVCYVCDWGGTGETLMEVWRGWCALANCRGLFRSESSLLELRHVATPTHIEALV